MKYLAALFLAIVLAFGPTPVVADHAPQLVCLKVEVVHGESVCVKTGNKDVDSRSPTIDVPNPVRTPRPGTTPRLPDIRLPSIDIPNGSSNSSNGPGSSGAGGTTINEAPQSSIPTSRNDVGAGPQPPNPQEVPDSSPSPSTDPKDPPGTVYEFQDIAWYTWVAVLVCGIGLGFMFFYDTEKPKRPKPRHKR